MVKGPSPARSPAFREGLKPGPGPSPTFKARARPGPVLLGPNPSLDYEDRKIDLTNLYDPLNKQFCGVSNNVLTDMTCCYLYTAEPLLMKGSGE